VAMNSRILNHLRSTNVKEIHLGVRLGNGA
jgi:hypothetical protein